MPMIKITQWNMNTYTIEDGDGPRVWHCKRCRGDFLTLGDMIRHKTDCVAIE